jgi:hypothetical protein
MDLHLVMEPIVPRGVQLLWVWAMLKGAYIWSKVPEDVFPCLQYQHKTMVTSCGLLTSTAAFAALLSPQVQKGKTDS